MLNSSCNNPDSPWYFKIWLYLVPYYIDIIRQSSSYLPFAELLLWLVNLQPFCLNVVLDSANIYFLWITIKNGTFPECTRNFRGRKLNLVTVQWGFEALLIIAQCFEMWWFIDKDELLANYIRNKVKVMCLYVGHLLFASVFKIVIRKLLLENYKPIRSHVKILRTATVCCSYLSYVIYRDWPGLLTGDVWHSLCFQGTKPDNELRLTALMISNLKARQSSKGKFWFLPMRHIWDTYYSVFIPNTDTFAQEVIFPNGKLHREDLFLMYADWIARRDKTTFAQGRDMLFSAVSSLLSGKS